ncbi:LuxR C-terminal-related transcriptional regulator [Embleya sp. NBC_00896]|uniref:LuxR C-terminal-related transcriptional regulator n=1 Tax=Embleya sp. NBC_00896 TaxID=2975961 RepID=UPI002F918309|nr:LuxR C-terminal-related transcriptional regulator [Embleya sp. NBC_00896]
MVDRVSEVSRARESAAREAWDDAYALLRTLDAADLTPDDLDALADAAWWNCRPQESVEARLKAYAGYAAQGNARRAGYTAWMLFYDYQDAGKSAVAAGWLQRARRHLGSEPECVEQCYLAWSDAEAARDRGALEDAWEAARRMTAIGRRCGNPDLAAMGLQVQGGVLLDQGRVTEGLALLDDAMCSVMAGELSAMFTGWIYCQALQKCMSAAQLERAAQWTEAAMAWSGALHDGNPFRGLCRVHWAEVLLLGGSWTRAAAEAELASEELLATDPRIAGEACYLAGELHRRRGEPNAAEAAFERAHALGYDPQPGLALLCLARGEAESSAAALRLALAGDEGGHWRDSVRRSWLLAAQVEIALAVGRVDAARAAAEDLAAVAARPPGSEFALLHALAGTARGAVAFAERDIDAAVPVLRQACDLWIALGVPYEAAQTRMTLAAAKRAARDSEGARLELRTAEAVFDRLGAVPDARRAAALLGEDRGRLPGELTQREVEVLRLVAAGLTNRCIAAELVISEHTVARHLNNIFVKLDVSSRAAATAFAFTHGLA